MDTNKYFKTHPSSTEVHQTSDGYLFASESDAKNHAKTLADKNVKKVTQKGEKEYTEENTSESPDVTATTAKTTTTKTTKK